jgi:hypothetical protein
MSRVFDDDRPGGDLEKSILIRGGVSEEGMMIQRAAKAKGRKQE